MTWTAPRTWVTGEVVTSTVMNTHVRDNFNSLLHSVEANASLVTVENTTDETSIYSKLITGGLMGANGWFEVILSGDWLQNYSVSEGWDIAVKYGGATVMADHWGPGGNQQSALYHPWALVVRSYNLASTSSQHMMAWLYSNSLYGPPPAPAVGYGNLGGASTGGLGASPTVDTTADQTLQVTIAPDAASSALIWRKKIAILRLGQN